MDACLMSIANNCKHPAYLLQLLAREEYEALRNLNKVGGRGDMFSWNYIF